MTWSLLYLGMIFGALIGYVFLHGPTRLYLGRWIKLAGGQNRRLIHILIFVGILLLIFKDLYIWAIGVQALLLLTIMHLDRRRTQLSRRNISMVLDVVQGVHAYVNSGMDIPSACRQLANHNHPQIVRLGTFLKTCFSLGLNDARFVTQHPICQKNDDLSRFLEALFSLNISGGDIKSWLTRHTDYLHNKLQFYQTLSVKTSQIQTQIYILTLCSWIMFAVILFIFPSARSVIYSKPICIQLITLGLGLQVMGIFTMKSLLHKTVAFQR